MFLSKKQRKTQGNIPICFARSFFNSVVKFFSRPMQNKAFDLMKFEYNVLISQTRKRRHQIVDFMKVLIC